MAGAGQRLGTVGQRAALGRSKEYVVDGTCTALVPGQVTQTRAYIYGCWLTLKTMMGPHQICLVSKADWTCRRSLSMMPLLTFGTAWALKNRGGC